MNGIRPDYQAPIAQDVGLRTYLVPFYVGDGSGALLLTVTRHAEFLRGRDGTCAFCHGDPCADDSPADSLIATFFSRNESLGNTCPCCEGRPT